MFLSRMWCFPKACNVNKGLHAHTWHVPIWKSINVSQWLAALVKVASIIYVLCSSSGQLKLLCKHIILGDICCRLRTSAQATSANGKRHRLGDTNRGLPQCSKLVHIVQLNRALTIFIICGLCTTLSNNHALSFCVTLFQHTFASLLWTWATTIIRTWRRLWAACIFCGLGTSFIHRRASTS